MGRMALVTHSIENGGKKGTPGVLTLLPSPPGPHGIDQTPCVTLVCMSSLEMGQGDKDEDEIWVKWAGRDFLQNKSK